MNPLYHATELFDGQGLLITTDIHELANLITQTETKTIAIDHESKLMRIEIGHAIRTIASIRNTTLTEAICDMDLCKTTHRAEKTFLKYARIAGSGVLMEMAKNPQISLSVLDEIASSKKPAAKKDEAKFLKRVVTDITDICNENIKDEGYDPESPLGRHIVLGVTRNQAVGVIRKVQIEMGVETKAGGGGTPERPGEKELQSKILQLLNLMRIMFLPAKRRDAWLAKHGLTQADVGATMLSLQADLVGACILNDEADDLKPESIAGLKKIAELSEII